MDHFIKLGLQRLVQGPPDRSDLKTYQARAIHKANDPNSPGEIIAHGTGAGKTRTSIEALKELHLPTTIVVPAALKENYRKELRRWAGGIPKNYSIESQQSVARKGLQYNPPGGALVLDEAHRVREPGSKLYQALLKSKAAKKLLLTASPVYNTPADVAPLVNLIAKKNILPPTEAEFAKQYIGQREVKPPFLQRMMGLKPGLVPELKDKSKLRKIMSKYVDYYKGAGGVGAEGYPASSEETIKVPMGSDQTDVYKAIMGQAPWWVRQKVKFGLPPGKGELSSMKAFLTGARQVSNTNAPFIRNPANAQSTKIDKAVSNLRGMMKTDPRFKAVVYSNYLQSGLDPYKRQLDKYHIPYGEFSGDIKDRERNDLVKQYNANKLKALLISSAGAEGLDLKGTKLLQVLEPHFNEEKIKQIIGRAVRYQSHEGLPEDEKKVLIQRYLAQPQAGIFRRMLGMGAPGGTDEYINAMARQKENLNQEMIDLMNQDKQPGLLSRLIHPND